MISRRSITRITSLLVPRSLRNQLLSRMLLIVAGLLLVIGLFQYLFMERFLYQNKASAIQRQIQSVPGEMWERFNSSKRIRGPAEAFIFFPASTVAFISKEGKMTVLSTLNGSSESTVPQLDPLRYSEALDMPTRNQKPRYSIAHQSAEGEQLIVLQAVRSYNGVTGVVQVSTSTKPMKNELYRQLLLFVGLSLAALIGGLLTFLPAIRRTLNPLSTMIATVEQIDSGKLNERLPEQGKPLEIDRLSHSFNRMLERLESSFLAEQEAKEQMRRFVADASHELRTPLTSIHGFLEVLLRGAASEPEQLTRALKSMYGESERIIKLVNDLLQLAKLDRAPELQLQPTDLSILVSDMEPQLRILAGDRDVWIETNQPAIMMLDSDKIKQVLLNLFANAVQHTDSATGIIRIVVNYSHGKNNAHSNPTVSLTISDNGTGIAEDHLPHLFERFYRIDSSRARKLGGAGLGLSISRAIIELHGGHIKGTSRLGEGSLFRIDLPVKE